MNTLQIETLFNDGGTLISLINHKLGEADRLRGLNQLDAAATFYSQANAHVSELGDRIWPLGRLAALDGASDKAPPPELPPVVVPGEPSDRPPNMRPESDGVDMSPDMPGIFARMMRVGNFDSDRGRNTNNVTRQYYSSHGAGYEAVLAEYNSQGRTPL